MKILGYGTLFSSVTDNNNYCVASNYIRMYVSYNPSSSITWPYAHIIRITNLIYVRMYSIINNSPSNIQFKFSLATQ